MAGVDDFSSEKLGETPTELNWARYWHWKIYWATANSSMQSMAATSEQWLLVTSNGSGGATM